MAAQAALPEPHVPPSPPVFPHSDPISLPDVPDSTDPLPLPDLSDPLTPSVCQPPQKARGLLVPRIVEKLRLAQTRVVLLTPQSSGMVAE